ncbi:MAG: nucleotide pyrophosphohydrolase [Euryarchaeota archaeon]|nr:nucleotide pyrophosphohydrolase [Euryarchaeota archaeon]
MKDETTTVAALREKVAAFIAEREWEQFHHPKDLAISISLEAAELLEHFQWDEKRPVDVVRRDARLIEEVSDEISDLLHYLLNLANVLGIDVSDAFAKKTAKNAEKYPVHAAKGKAIKYDRLRNHQEPTLTDDEL